MSSKVIPGEIVFKLVEYGILGRTENDSIADFEKGYDFLDAFETPFMPQDIKK